MSMYSEVVSEAIRAQIEAMDFTLEQHWLATGHTVLLTTFPVGWTCSQCPESFALQPIEVRE